MIFRVFSLHLYTIHTGVLGKNFFPRICLVKLKFIIFIVIISVYFGIQPGFPRQFFYIHITKVIVQIAHMWYFIDILLQYKY